MINVYCFCNANMDKSNESECGGQSGRCGRLSAKPNIRQVGDADKKQTVHHVIRQTQLSQSEMSPLTAK